MMSNPSARWFAETRDEHSSAVIGGELWTSERGYFQAMLARETDEGPAWAVFTVFGDGGWLAGWVGYADGGGYRLAGDGDLGTLTDGRADSLESAMRIISLLHYVDPSNVSTGPPQS